MVCYNYVTDGVLCNHHNKSVIGTPQCQILHYIFHSVAIVQKLDWGILIFLTVLS